MPKHLLIHKEGSSIGAVFSSGTDDLSDILEGSTELGSVAPKQTQGVTSITFTGHSNNALFGLSHDRRNVSFISPEELADSIAAKIISDPDKSKLTDFYLLSCEAGLSVDGKPSFAQKFSEEMRKRKFDNLQVHAMTNPATKTPMTGMVVQVEGKVSDKTKISSWCYQSTDNEERDAEIQKQIKSMQSEIQTREIKPARRNELKAQISKLEKEQEGLRFYVCRAQPYTEAMGRTNNTFVNGQVKARMTDEVAQTIQWLEEFMKAEKPPLGITQDDNRNYLAQELIKALEQNPQQNAAQILATFDKLVKNEFSGFVNKLNKFSSADSIEQLKNGLSEQLKPEPELEFSIGGIVSAPDTKDTEKDYLNKLLSKDGFWAQIVNAITGTEEFARDLALQLKIIKSDGARLAVEQHTILKTIPEGMKTDKSKLTTGVFFKSDTPVKNLYNTIINHFTKGKGSWEDVSKAYQAYQEYATDHPKQKSVALEKIYTKLEMVHTKILKVQSDKNIIKDKMVDFIDAYLVKHTNDIDEIHIAKKNVMEAMKTYIKDPTPQKWLQLQNETTNPKNTGWNKGLFSQVESMMNKVEAYHEQESGSAKKF